MQGSRQKVKHLETRRDKRQHAPDFQVASVPVAVNQAMDFMDLMDFMYFMDFKKTL